MRKNYCIMILLAFAFSIASAQQVKYHRISSTITPSQLHKIFKDGLQADHYSYDEQKYFIAEVSDEDIAIFKKNKIPFIYIIEDLEKNLAAYNDKINTNSINENRSVTTPANFILGTYRGFYTMAEMQEQLDKMRILYPNLITVKTSIGNSVENRPIHMVKISDNPDIDEAEPEVFMNALHHAREPMSMSQLIFMMWHLLENYNTDKDIQTMLNSTEIYIVPCVNPDGYVYNQTTTPAGGGMWRKNRRKNSNGTYGVDINRNYGYKWGYDNSGSSGTASSDTYRGTSAFSEPETQAIKDFCNNHSFTVSMDFHSSGNYVIYPYSYVATNNNPELSLFQKMGGFLTTENNFKHGNCTQALSYLTNGSGEDWKYGEQTSKPKIYSSIVEVGTSSDGFWPASSRIIPLCNSTIEMNKKAIKIGTYYSTITSTTVSRINTINGSVTYDFQNYSIKPASYTISLTPLNNHITSIGANKTYTGFTMLQTQNDNIAFTLDPNTPFGTQLQFLLTVDNGLFPRTDTVKIVYDSLDCSIPLNLSTTNIASKTATLNWGAVTGATNYTIEYKTQPSSTWSIAATTTSLTTNLIGLIPSTPYDWRVKTNCSANNTSNYTAATFTTTATSINYCASNGKNISYMWIDYVSLGTINKTSAASTGGYFNGTSMSTNLVKGTTSTLKYSGGFSSSVYRLYWRAWIDYNNNGVFTDAGEQILNTNLSGSGNYTLTFTPPTSAVTATTRMRIAAKYGSAPTPCESFSYGEVEDYTINLVNNSPIAQQVFRLNSEDENALGVTIFPNPVNERFTLQFNTTSSNNRNILITTIQGTEVFSKTIPGNSNDLEITTDSFISGIYFLILQEGDNKKVLKICKL